MQKLYRNPVGRFDEGHVPVARGAMDRVTRREQRRAGFVDIIDAVGEVPEIAPADVFLGSAAIFGRPIVGQFDFGHPFLPRRRKENQREAPRLAVEAAHFCKPDQLEECHGRLGVGHAGACVECRTGLSRTGVRSLSMSKRT